MAERPTYPKTGCVVPFCRRRSTRFKNEWICGDHWRMVPRSLKVFRTRRRREIKRLYEKYTATYEAMCAARDQSLPWTDEEAAVFNTAMWKSWHAGQRWDRFEAAIWRRMKKAAIERATGI